MSTSENYFIFYFFALSVLDLRERYAWSEKPIMSIISVLLFPMFCKMRRMMEFVGSLA
jgi:hypothetical protein